MLLIRFVYNTELKISVSIRSLVVRAMPHCLGVVFCTRTLYASGVYGSVTDTVLVNLLTDGSFLEVQPLFLRFVFQNEMGHFSWAVFSME